jgi:hypothetical protein
MLYGVYDQADLILSAVFFIENITEATIFYIYFDYFLSIKSSDCLNDIFLENFYKFRFKLTYLMYAQ